MNAVQIIEEIKLLSPTEKGQVIEFVSELTNQTQAVSHADDATADAVAERVMQKNTQLLDKLAR